MESAGKAAANGIMLGFGAVLVMIAFGLLGTNWYLRIYTDDPAVISAGVTYIRTVSLLAFGNIFTQISFSVLQGSGNMTFPMISQLVGEAGDHCRTCYHFHFGIRLPAHYDHMVHEERDQ